ncbi:DUF397 domain-containing protein [Streptomyces sp. BH-SS-21]|uniref:DUF397 domain-containing protein n=1 Tax=Streptomyces liliiviolaceus TaxID=2823109 RepID=A0A940XUT2_9ACTN|nr:DUF397 domain-containing protein [Streptomyces liliiviolaceus]MBQ0846930.1 DUF397 domain-containing protein [Streptomyces liliiviolaceus]
MTELRWQKSSFSSEASNCLELATTPDGSLHLRESDDPATTLAFDPAGLRSLLAAVRQEISIRS